MAGRFSTTEPPGKSGHTHKKGDREFNKYNLSFLIIKIQMFKFSNGNLFFILTMEVFFIIREN